MPANTKRVPSLIFCVGSSASLSSAVSYQTLDTQDPNHSSLRGIGQSFGLMSVDSSRISAAPSLPQRKTSQRNIFRMFSSSFDIDHQDTLKNIVRSTKPSTMKNATFDLHTNQNKLVRQNSRPSLLDRFGVVPPAPVVSPPLSQRSRKTVASEGSCDTPLSIPRRLPSDMSFSSPASKKSITSFNSKMSGYQNASFRDLLKNSSQNSKRQVKSPMQAKLLNMKQVRM